MNVVFFDAQEWADLRPLTLTKPFAELRMGIYTFKERWQELLKDAHFSYQTEAYLAEKYPIYLEEINLFLNPSYFPNGLLIDALKKLKTGESLWQNHKLIAARVSFEDFQNVKKTKFVQFEGGLVHIAHLWDLFTHNAYAIQMDFDWMTQGRVSQKISSTNGVINAQRIFIEEGAVVEFATLNAKEGPIYIGKNAEIMEGAMIRGGLALGEGAKINMGAKIYSGTTIGPHCKVGGEVNNSILMGYSNKGHDGFLGNSVIGEWCNLGADTNNSNLKNNYSAIRVWNYTEKGMINTGLQFCGLMMGDFSKSAINTQFNTGTVVGVSANVFDAGFTPKFIPSFSWGGNDKTYRYDLEKSFEAAERMMERRKKILTENDKRILNAIFAQGADY